MDLLNQHLSYDDVATEESRALFRGGKPIGHEWLPTGTLLSRFVPVRPYSAVCPWWILFRPFTMSNRQRVPGLGDFLYESGCRIGAWGQLVEAPGCRISCMEHASRLTLVRLMQPVYAWMGPSSQDRPEPCGGAFILHGGEFRVWIPGLAANMIIHVPIPRELHVPPPVAAEADEPARTGPARTGPADSTHNDADREASADC
jgi:hypothetical protein